MTEEQAKTATLDELRDWLHRDKALQQLSPGHGHDMSWAEQHWDNTHLRWCDKHDQHQYPPTLDGAAAALPEGWDWWKVTAEWAAQAAHMPMIRTKDTGDEIADRYRLAVLCRLAEKAVAK